jgi:hypothetical protein
MAASPEAIAHRTLESLRADYAYNLRLLAQRDGELQRYDTAWSQITTQLQEARREACWWQQQAQEQAAHAAALAEQVAVLESRPPVVHEEAQTVALDVATAAVQTSGSGPASSQAAEGPEDSLDDVHALRDANQRLKRTIAAMRAHMEAEAAAAAAAAAVPGRDEQLDVLLRRCQRDNARLHAERDLLIDTCNALRAPAASPSIGSAVLGAFPACLDDALMAAPPPLRPLPPHVNVATQTVVAARPVVPREMEPPTSDVIQLALQGSAARAQTREPPVLASHKVTSSQAMARDLLRRHKLLLPTCGARVRNWALRDE